MSLQITQRVTFSTVASIAIPLGVGYMSSNFWQGLTVFAFGVLALVLREVFKSI